MYLFILDFCTLFTSKIGGCLSLPVEGIPYVLKSLPRDVASSWLYIWVAMNIPGRFKQMERYMISFFSTSSTTVTIMCTSVCACMCMCVCVHSFVCVCLLRVADTATGWKGVPQGVSAQTSVDWRLLM